MAGYLDAFARVEVLRAEAQDVLLYLAPVVEAAKTDDPTVYALIEELNVCLAEKREDLDAFGPAIAALVRENAEVGSGVGDLLTQIRNALRAALRALDRLQAASPPDLVSVRNRGEKAVSALNDLVLHAGFLTIPDRVNAHLKEISVGASLNFETEFRDELPSDTDRASVLAFLANHPAAIHGWVDTEKGMIYRTSQSQLVRIFTYVAPALVAALVLGAIYVTDVLRDGHNWRDALLDRNSWLPTIAAVLAGAILHLGIARLKRIHFGTDLEIIPLSKRLTWLHLRWVSVSGSIVPVFIVWVLLTWHGNHSLLAYFFGGYAVDSIAEIALGRLELAGGAGARQLVESLKPRASQATATPGQTTAGF